MLDKRVQRDSTLCPIWIYTPSLELCACVSKKQEERRVAHDDVIMRDKQPMFIHWLL